MNEGMNGAPKALSRSFPYTLPDSTLRGRKETWYFLGPACQANVGGRRLGSKRFWKEEAVQKLLTYEELGSPSQPLWLLSVGRGRARGEMCLNRRHHEEKRNATLLTPTPPSPEGPASAPWRSAPIFD